ncbi:MULTISPECIES: VirB8/TrbF family protein [Shewanella]|uniref:VirB8/TrbF family protein n=2 Tax=Shewanella TaxID=22 RepID=A0ABU9UWT4_9GAMM|nr:MULTISPECIES: VirB8/TrbF family protein [Shewanella]ABX51849.1 conserved hypothetical conjugal transfer protein TrbF [Shewanella baltica OS195]MBW3533396.1 conjugal transfer protein TrbF [Shewanella sp. NKUCC06_TVS]
MENTPSEVSASSQDELTLLYARARHEWDERLGDTLSQNKNLKLITLVALCIALAAVFGVIYIGSQSKIEPYVFGMNEGQVIALQAAKSMPADDRKKLEMTKIGEIVEYTRTVFTDINAQRTFVLKAYAHLRSSDPAFMQINTYLSQTSPPNVRAETEVVTIKIESILPLGDKAMTYQVEWTELITDRKGVPKPSQHFKAAVEIYYSLPTTPQEFMKNPLGLWVKYFNVTERF